MCVLQAKNNANYYSFQSASSAALICVLCIGGFCLVLFVWVLIFFKEIRYFYNFIEC